MSVKLTAVIVVAAVAVGGCASSSFGTLERVGAPGILPAHAAFAPLAQGAAGGSKGAGKRFRLGSDTGSAIHGPMRASLLGEFIAPSNPDFDEAYGINSRVTLHTWENWLLGADIGYARMKNADAKGLIKGELHRYTALCWAEYRLTLGRQAKGTWSPAVHLGAGLGWYAAQPVPHPDREEDIESQNRRLRVGVISTGIVRGSVKLCVPLVRTTQESLTGGNADLVVGIGVDFGTGTAKYTIKDFTAGIKSESHDRVVLDAFHVFLGLSFRF